MDITIRAVREGDEEEVIRLLDADPTLIEIADRGGMRLLAVAAEHGQLGMVKLLVQRGATISATGDQEMTALHYAAIKGHEQVASFLLSKGIQANSRNEAGKTPLMLASTSDRLGVVQVLAEHTDAQGLEERDDEGRTALHWAADGGHGEIVTFLLSKGAQANSKDDEGATPLMMACWSGYLGVVLLLLQLLGAQGLEERDNDGWTALHYAAYFGHEKVVRCFMLAGADPSITDDDGKTPRALAEEEEENDDDMEKEGKVKCVALFEWWDVELERRAILARATCLHRADTMRRDMPTSQVPTYLEARVAAGHAVPRVEVVSPQSEERQDGEDDKERGDASGKRKAAGEGGNARDTEEEQDEIHAVLEYVVTALNEELAIELLEGFHRKK